VNPARFIPLLQEFLKSLVLQIALVFILFLLRLLGVDVYTKLQWLVRLLVLFFRRLTGRKTFLIYTDCSDHMRTTRTLARRLDGALRNQRYKSIVLRNPEAILTYPLWPFAVSAVILIITDVSPLSSNERKRKIIQKRLVRFSQNGGSLILTHDAIYRRSKNDILQGILGCILSRFVFQTETYYVKNSGSVKHRVSRDTNLLKALPDEFPLSDGEVLVGNWANGVEFIYVSKEDPNIPLLTRRENGKGVVYWLNSGDSTEIGPPESISMPDDHLVKILGTLITSAVK